MYYDLSHVLFIATANNIHNIQQPFLDIMEMIDITGYIIEEKVEIARKHLVPKQKEAHGLTEIEFEIPKKTLEALVKSYTSESGVRQLDKKIAMIMRKLALKIALKKEYPSVLNPENLKDFLGAEIFLQDKYEGNEYAGVVTGLAWTSVGGEILYVESSLSKIPGEKLTLPGNLGDVMTSSASLAQKYLPALAPEIGVECLWRGW